MNNFREFDLFYVDHVLDKWSWQIGGNFFTFINLKNQSNLLFKAIEMLKFTYVVSVKL